MTQVKNIITLTNFEELRSMYAHASRRKRRVLSTIEEYCVYDSGSMDAIKELEEDMSEGKRKRHGYVDISTPLKRRKCLTRDEAQEESIFIQEEDTNGVESKDIRLRIDGKDIIRRQAKRNGMTLSCSPRQVFPSHLSTESKRKRKRRNESPPHMVIKHRQFTEFYHENQECKTWRKQPKEPFACFF